MDPALKRGDTPSPKSLFALRAAGAGALLLVCSVLTAAGSNWPAWRGPAGTGVCSEQDLPLRWSTNENIRWKVPLPDRGNSTPIVWGRRVFVTQAVPAKHQRLLLCFDRTEGKLLWQQGPTVAEDESTHETNPQCSASPVTDGERVVAWFGSGGLYCFDLEGRELWHRELGRQTHIWGNGSSPVLDNERCFLNFGPGEPSFLVALDKKTGRELWRVAETNADSGEKKPGQEKAVWAGSWSTPVLIRREGHEEMLLSWPKRLISFAPANGQELWRCTGLNPLVYTSALYDDATGIAVAMGGFGGMSIAVKAGGTGDVTQERCLWHHPKTKQRIGSGVLYQDHIYILNDPGVAECFELRTGKLVWEERLKGPGPRSDNWSSFVLAGDRLYGINQGGDAFVVRASPKFEVLATNSIGEPTISSIAASDGELFIRTHRQLWCVGRPASSGQGR
jgi:outer membrane protein assembly factor BamB